MFSLAWRFSIARKHSPPPSFCRSLIPKRMGILRTPCRWPHSLTRYTTYHATVPSLRGGEHADITAAVEVDAKHRERAVRRGDRDGARAVRRIKAGGG